MSISNEIKGYIITAGQSIQGVAGLLGITRQSLYTKLNNESIRYKDAQEIARLLGYEIQWVKRE
jgi:hypothetical protein